MKVKKSLVLLLAVTMVLAMFSACTDQKTESTGEQDMPTQATAEQTDEMTEEMAGEPAEIVEIEVWLMDMLGTTGNGDKAELVESAINELTEQEIGVHINFTWFDPQEYLTHVGLSIANNEPVDVTVLMMNFTDFYNKGSMMDITDLAQEYGQDILSTLGEEVLSMTTVDGKLYGFPIYRQLNSNLYLAMRTDMLETAGVLEEAKNVDSWSDYESIMQAIADSGQTTYAIGNAGGYGLQGEAGFLLGSDAFSDTISFDALGDNTYTIYTDQEGNVELYVEQPEFIEYCKMVKKWYDAGWVWPETAYAQGGAEEQVRSGVFASYIVKSEYGVEVNKSQTIMTDMTCIEISKGYLSTTAGQQFGMFVPVTSQEPEAAMKFLNLLYSSSDLMNYMIWGVEGETYVVKDTGEAAYPEGLNAMTVGWHGMEFSLGNQFILLPWEGQGSTFREDSLEDLQMAPKSEYLGLTVDANSTHSDLLAAIMAVRDEYYPALTGGFYTDELYDEFINKLKDAGVDEWVALYQTAVDEFMGK